MACLRANLKKGHRYHYIVKSGRDEPDGKWRQLILEHAKPESKLLAATMRE